ncbi:hypothetical protein INR49_005681 [Caranx melampygus]|nr:hypothetical protein INR49_005681 [Caranx melampygus]
MGCSDKGETPPPLPVKGSTADYGNLLDNQDLTSPSTPPPPPPHQRPGPPPLPSKTPPPPPPKTTRKQASIDSGIFLSKLDYLTLSKDHYPCYIEVPTPDLSEFMISLDSM